MGWFFRLAVAHPKPQSELQSPMPLDAGPVSEHLTSGDAGQLQLQLLPQPVVLEPHGSLGAALRAARESLGLSVEDIAQATRVRAVHVAALESLDLDALPARPFVIGYVRAYARALGLETESVVDRFRAELPPADDELRAPGGLRGQFRGRGLGRLAIGAALLVAAVVAWNITRHISANPRRPMTTAHRVAPVGPIAGPAQLGAPLPAPPEAAAPPAYLTPGLSTNAPQPVADPTGAPFVAAGTVFGATGAGGRIILQARKATTLIVRGPDGAVYFARELAPGEAWRAPQVEGLVADVGNPASMEVFVDGLSRGDLSESKTPLSVLGTGAPHA